MLKKFIFILGGGVLLMTMLWWLNSQTISTSPKNPSGPLLVSTSFYPLYYFTSQIGGDKIQVRNITPAGAEPHNYEPTPEDLVAIENSKLLILNGDNLEAWGNKIKDELKDAQVKVLEVGTGLATHTMKEEGKTITDPHIWLNPILAKQEVWLIAQALSEIDPAHKNYYQINAERLGKQLNELDQKFRTGLKTCQKKEIITSHSAFAYLATAYELVQVPITGLSPDEEPSPQQFARIAQFAKQHKIQYIFFESLVSPKISQTIASEIGAQTLVLNPLEGLSDEEIKQGKNYFTEMENNLINLKIALACQ